MPAFFNGDGPQKIGYTDPGADMRFVPSVWVAFVEEAEWLRGAIIDATTPYQFAGLQEGEGDPEIVKVWHRELAIVETALAQMQKIEEESERIWR